MSNFDFYMIDMIKDYSDRLRNKENDKDVQWMLNNVLDELIRSYAEYRTNNLAS